MLINVKSTSYVPTKVKGTALVFLQLSNDIGMKLEKNKKTNLNENKSDTALAAFVTAAGK